MVWVLPGKRHITPLAWPGTQPTHAVALFGTRMQLGSVCTARRIDASPKSAGTLRSSPFYRGLALLSMRAAAQGLTPCVSSCCWAPMPETAEYLFRIHA